MDLGLPGIYYNDLIVCVPRVGDLSGIAISVNGHAIGVTDERGLRLHGPQGTPTTVYRPSGAIDLHIPWVRPRDVTTGPTPPTIHPIAKRNPTQPQQQMRRAG